MRHFVVHKGISITVIQRGTREYSPVVAGVPLGGARTLEDAVSAAKAHIDRGAITKVRSTVSWPDSPSTTREVDLGGDCAALRFSEFVFRTLSKGGTVTIEPAR